MPKENKKFIENFCKSQNENLNKIIFLNIPTPEYFNKNLMARRDDKNVDKRPNIKGRKLNKRNSL